MKPCAKNRKLIAWLALDELDARQASDLRVHVESCEGCRRYLEKVSNVTQKLTAAEIQSDIRASESFHQRLVRRLKAGESISLSERVVAPLRATFLNWRVALPVIGAAAALIATLAIVTQQPDVPAPPPTAVQTSLTPNVQSDLDPTVANYQMVANKSFEKLDELLTRQGNRNPSPAPTYTASTFLRANPLD